MPSARISKSLSITAISSNDVFAILPWREQILESLLCCDVVGFHIPRYTENFARAASTLIGCERGPKHPVDAKFITVGTALSEATVTDWLQHNGRRIQLLSSPVGTSPDVIQQLSWSASVENYGELIVQDTKKGRKLILSASRVDYTKGNEELLLAFERLLERRSDLHGEVVLMLACVAAASGMKIYEDTQRSIEEIAGRINGRFIRSTGCRSASRRIPTRR